MSVSDCLSRKHIDHEEMSSCLLKEINTRLKMCAVDTVTSIYFGGGRSVHMVDQKLRTVFNRQTYIACLHMLYVIESNSCGYHAFLYTSFTDSVYSITVLHFPQNNCEYLIKTTLVLGS